MCHLVLSFCRLCVPRVCRPASSHLQAAAADWRLEQLVQRVLVPEPAFPVLWLSRERVARPGR